MVKTYYHILVNKTDKRQYILVVWCYQSSLSFTKYLGSLLHHPRTDSLSISENP